MASLNKNSYYLWFVKKYSSLIFYVMNFLWFILIGILAGYIAGKLMKGGGFGLIINLIVGIVGGVLGGWLFGILGISTGSGIIGSLVTAVIGAVVLLFIISLVKKK